MMVRIVRYPVQPFLWCIKGRRFLCLLSLCFLMLIFLSSRNKFLERISRQRECILPEEILVKLNLESRPATLLLATTFSSDYSKKLIYTNTLRNWGALKSVVPILYVDDAGRQVWSKLAEANGWKVRGISHSAVGLPIFREIMIDLLRLQPRHPLIGYANADILFDESLLLTLSALFQHLRSKSWIISGQRINVPLNKSVSNLKQIRQLALLPEASMSTGYGQDYFIGCRDAVNWPVIPPFVVGRLAWDNWLLDYIHHHSYAIDSSKTVLALHQSEFGSENVSSLAPNNSYNLRMYRKTPIGLQKARCLPKYTHWADHFNVSIFYRYYPCLW